MTVTVIGAGSLIARTLKCNPATTAWRFLGHTQARANTDWVTATTVVLNCAFDDRLKQERYQAELDFDLQLSSQLACHQHLRYVMLSSRMVYGPAPLGGRLQVGHALAPINAYGHAKQQTEAALLGLWGRRLTVFRLSNVFGMELQPQRRNFFGMALRTLNEQQRILLDISPFVERDFLPVNALAAQLVTALGDLQPGTFNLGAGFGLPVGRIAQWLIEGHGQGEMVVTQMREHDAFWLDMQHTRQVFGLPTLSAIEIRQNCLSLGAQLRTAS